MGKVVVDGPVDISIEEAFTATRLKAKTKRAAPELMRAIGLLAEWLDGGPVAAAEVIEKAEAAGIGRNTPHRARKELGVVSERKGFGKGSAAHWCLPDWGFGDDE